MEINARTINALTNARMHKHIYINTYFYINKIYAIYIQYKKRIKNIYELEQNLDEYKDKNKEKIEGSSERRFCEVLSICLKKILQC